MGIVSVIDYDASSKYLLSDCPSSLDAKSGRLRPTS